MIYDVEGVRGPEFPPGSVYTEDALGRVLSPLQWCDTETGEACRVVRTPDGKYKIGPDGLVVRETAFYPAPLVRRSGRFPMNPNYASFQGDSASERGDS